MTSNRLTIGWVGLGAMGAPMVRRLVAAGHVVLVWRRSARSAVPEGAIEVDRLAALPARADIVGTIVGGPADVRELYLGPAGLVASGEPGQLLVDFSTSSPQLAREVHAVALERGIAVLDAPVSGGPFGAADGALSMMVGGDAAAVARAQPALDALASQIVHHGSAGSGQAAKLVNQALVGATMLGIADAWAMASDLGLEPERVVRSLEAGVAGSPLLRWAWQRAAQVDRTPGFRIGHLVKDLEIAHREVSRDLPAVALALARYRALADDGHRDEGTQALILEGTAGA